MSQAPPLTVPPFQAVSGSYRMRQQCHRVQRLINALLPALPPGDVLAVLKDRKFFAELDLDLGAQAIAELADPAVIVLIIEAGVAHKRRGLTWHETPLPSRNQTADRAIHVR